MSLSPYRSYKPSGVEWLDEVPCHWSISRLKQICHIRPSNVDKKTHEGEHPVRLCNYTDVYYNDEITHALTFMEASATADQIDRFELRSGDVIITKDSETSDDIAIAAYVPEDMPGIVCGYHLALLRHSEGVSGRFLKRYFDSIFAKSCFAVRANGLTRVGLSQYSLANVDVPLPPLPEQQAIAAFLDRETAKIDALVTEQERLIALLAEKRRAVISHAVTRGLNPNAPMKDSGIEWLGEVPAHWEIKRLKHIGYFKAGAGFPDDEQGVEGEALSFHKVNALGKAGPDERLIDSENTVSPETAVRLRAFVFPEGSIVFAKIGAALLLGRLRMLREPACLDNNMMGFMVEPPNNSRYARYLMNLVRFDLIANPGTVPSLNEGPIANLAFGIAPAGEQVDIAAYLDRTSAKLDTLTTEAERAIALLKERRAALISAAVTGKIDVRDAVRAEEVAA